jgi:hypothetical protein
VDAIERGGRRGLVLAAVRDLEARARQMAQTYPMNSDEWQFYAGVQRAAQDALRPETQSLRNDEPAWLHAERASFRDGYLKASAGLAAATVSPAPPLRLPLPAMI